ncbi:MAG: hypothetical protein CVV33_02235, partial [Methanomicrobiales archaeon HGW-Methanomicrobiales-4]
GIIRKNKIPYINHTDLITGFVVQRDRNIYESRICLYTNSRERLFISIRSNILHFHERFHTYQK